MTVDSYESMLTVLRDMSDEDKETLVNKVKELVGSGNVKVLTDFLAEHDNVKVFLSRVRIFTEEVSKRE